MSHGEADQLALRERLAYGCGDFASVLYWQTFMVYLTFFYTDVFGLTAAAAGAMLGMSRSLDALTDPLMGMLADRTRSRHGRFRPYLLWLAAPFAVAGVLTFTVPSLSESGKLVWAWVTYNLLMLLYTGINIPYTSLLGVLTPDPRARTALSSIKFLFAFAAGMLVSATLLPMVRTLGGGAAGWQRSFMLIGVLAAGLFLLTFFGTRERVTGAEQRTPLGRDLRDLLGNRPWLILVAATLLLILFVAVRSSVTVHYFKYVVGEPVLALPAWPMLGGTRRVALEELVSAFNASGQLASLLGVVLLPRVARALGQKRTFVCMFSLSAAATAAFSFLRPDQVGAMLLLNLLGSLTGGPLSALLWAMYADTVDYAEWKYGRRATGLVFSASAFAQKQGWALGAWGSLSLMQSVGFVANVEPSPASRQALSWLMGVVPAGFAVASILLLALYPLNEEALAKLHRELAKRRSAAT